MKRILIGLGILIALLLVIALALPFLIDANEFRPRLEAALSKALGREVRLGNLKLSLLEGGVAASDLSIADDPAFSKLPFLGAKTLTVGVELRPLIFSRKLSVTGIGIDDPEIALIQSAAGVWNFASLGGKSDPKPEAAPGAVPEFSVKLLKITNGRVSLKMPNEPRPFVLEKLNIEVKDFTPAVAFPFSLTTGIQGGGDLKLTGTAGPINNADASATPFNAALKLTKLDIVKSGFARAETGFAGLVSVDGTAAFNGRTVQLQGAIQAEQLKLAKGGKPARRNVGFNFTSANDLRRRSGVLPRGEIHIGSAKAELTGTYQAEGAETNIKMTLSAPSMAVAELTEMLPALDIVLPHGSSLQGGTLEANLTVEGPTSKLVSNGSVALKKTRLAGFDLGSRMNTVAKLTGIKVSPDTDFDNISADVRAAPGGISVQSISVIAPAIGELSGAGTISPVNALDFKMRAKLHTGALMNIVTPSGETSIPFSIAGTSAEPKFVPDVKGIVGGMAAERLKPLTDTDVGKAATGIMDLFKRKKQN